MEDYKKEHLQSKTHKMRKTHFKWKENNPNVLPLTC